MDEPVLNVNSSVSRFVVKANRSNTNVEVLLSMPLLKVWEIYCKASDEVCLILLIVQNILSIWLIFKE